MGCGCRWHKEPEILACVASQRHHDKENSVLREKAASSIASFDFQMALRNWPEIISRQMPKRSPNFQDYSASDLSEVGLIEQLGEQLQLDHTGKRG